MTFILLPCSVLWSRRDKLSLVTCIFSRGEWCIFGFRYDVSVQTYFCSATNHYRFDSSFNRALISQPDFTPLSLFSDLSSLPLSQPSSVHTRSMSVKCVGIHLQKLSIKIPGSASIMHHLWPCCLNGLETRWSGFILKLAVEPAHLLKLNTSLMFLSAATSSTSIKWIFMWYVSSLPLF